MKFKIEVSKSVKNWSFEKLLWTLKLEFSIEVEISQFPKNAKARCQFVHLSIVSFTGWGKKIKSWWMCTAMSVSTGIPLPSSSPPPPKKVRDRGKKMAFLLNGQTKTTSWTPARWFSRDGAWTGRGGDEGEKDIFLSDRFKRKGLEPPLVIFLPVALSAWGKKYRLLPSWGRDDEPVRIYYCWRKYEQMTLLLSMHLYTAGHFRLF